jgi:hypothetical protein
VGGRMVQACSQQGLLFPSFVAADEHDQTLPGESNTAGQVETYEGLDASALLAACAAWIPPADCSETKGVIQSATAQQAKKFPVERFSSWLPAALSSSIVAAEGDVQLSVAALRASASSWLPPTSNEKAPCVEVRRLADALRNENATNGFAMQVQLYGVSAWLPFEDDNAVAAMTTVEVGFCKSSALASISAWMPQTDSLQVHPVKSHDKSEHSQPQSTPCLKLEPAKHASIYAWLPACNTSAAIVQDNLDGADSDIASILSSLAAWLPQTAPASSPAPKTQHPRLKPLCLPKQLALPLLPPPLPGQCDVVEVDPSSSARSKQSLPVRTSATLPSTAALATEKYSASGIGVGEGQVSSRRVSNAGGSIEVAPTAGRAAVGGGIHLEPLPRLMSTRRTRG